MKAWPLSQQNQHYPFTTCYTQPGLSVTLRGAASHIVKTSAILSSAQQIYNRSQETIFGKTRLRVAIITREHTKLLIAEYQLFTVSCSERAADFMDINHLSQRVYCTSPSQCHTQTHTIYCIFQLSLMEMTENLWAWCQSTAESMNKTCLLNVIVNVRHYFLRHSYSFYTLKRFVTTQEDSPARMWISPVW